MMRTAISPRLAISTRRNTQRSSSQAGFRFSRNARRPSWPSRDARRAAIASVVTGAASSSGRPAIRAISALAAATASGPAREDRLHAAADGRVELRRGDDRVHEADLARARAR